MENLSERLFKTHAGVTLIETLIAAAIIGAFLPCAFGALGKLSLAELKLQNNAGKASRAAWWLNRLPINPTQDDFAAMPIKYETSAAKELAFFAWEIENGDYGSFNVTLSVTNSPEDDAPFVARVIY